MSVIAVTSMSSFAQALPSAVVSSVGMVVGSVGGAVVVEDEAGLFESFGSPELEPGRTTMRMMTTMTATRPRPTTRRRRQYTLLDWGPTGCLSVDIPTE